MTVSEQKPNMAVEYVAAHLSKIHGLDWHPENEFILATSSQDNSVRVGTADHISHVKCPNTHSPDVYVTCIISAVCV